MIVGVGTDIIEISRIEEKLKRGHFIKIYSDIELENIKKRGNRVETYAGVFAAKEAVYKSLALENLDLSIADIEIINKENGIPQVKIDKFSEKKYRFFLSISHCNDYAVAYVVTEF